MEARDRRQLVPVGEMALLELAGRGGGGRKWCYVKGRERGTRLERWQAAGIAMGQASILLSSSFGGKKRTAKSIYEKRGEIAGSGNR